MINNHSLPIKLAKDTLDTGILKFPGKIAIDSTGSRLAVSDTGNHRILLVDPTTGIVNAKVGGKTGAGMKDGGYGEVMLNAPQGVTWHGEYLFVADTENHVIRKVTSN